MRLRDIAVSRGITERSAYGTVLGLAPGHARRAGWQSSSRFKDVAAKAPSLAEVVAAGTPGRDTLTILTLLRNTVHEAGLPALAVAGLPGRPGATLAGLPRGDSAQIIAAFNRRGGREAWGLRELLPGRPHAEPGVLPGRLLPAAIELLNELMTGTPAGTLSGVSLKD